MLFGEAPARVIVTCRQGAVDDLLQLAEERGTPAARLGEVTAGRFTVRRGGEVLVDEEIGDLHAEWRGALEGYLGAAHRPAGASGEEPEGGSGE
jgi:hypothetical protein